ncbi:G patch domain-containing protein 4 [Quaeritorhiza haematococci]|nr:G patch domain-containing protein 4 [Quaeritorhiza haematococci]
MFAERVLTKLGWRKGKGLGKRQEGITRAVSVAFKDDRRGLGAEADEWNSQWWNHVFNTATANVTVHKDVEGEINVKSTKTEGNSAAKALLYGRFVKASVMVSTHEEHHHKHTLVSAERATATITEATIVANTTSLQNKIVEIESTTNGTCERKLKKKRKRENSAIDASEIDVKIPKKKKKRKEEGTEEDEPTVTTSKKKKSKQLEELDINGDENVTKKKSKRKSKSEEAEPELDADMVEVKKKKKKKKAEKEESDTDAIKSEKEAGPAAESNIEDIGTKAKKKKQRVDSKTIDDDTPRKQKKKAKKQKEES